MKVLAQISCILFACGAASCQGVSGTVHAGCSSGDELQLVQQQRFQAARASWMRRKEEPESALGLALTSAWGVGTPANVAQSRQVMDALDPRSRDLAVSRLQQCANAGSSGARLLLGIAYYGGIGVQRNLESAREYFGGAAPADNSIALVGAAAVAHASGQQSEADALLEQVAGEAGGISEYAVGAGFYLGVIFQQDYVQAAKWLRRAAEKGDARAQGTLGYMYAIGRGVEQDQRQAEYWLNRQASNPLSSDRESEPLIEGYWEKK